MNHKLSLIIRWPVALALGLALLAGCNLPAAPKGPLPSISHIVLIVLENHEYGKVVGNPQMPNFNRLAQQYTLLTQDYAVRHPSLPNYLALIGGDTFGVDSDCSRCFQNQRSLPDELEAAGHTWKTYQENMPESCAIHDTQSYDKNHNPFIYFDPIRTDPARCAQSVVPLTQLDADLQSGKLADFVFIAPNVCNDAHSCGLEVADQWLGTLVEKLTRSPAWDEHSLLVITFDEGTSKASCCGLGQEGGGQIATVLVSPLVKQGFEDATPYSHYSLLKTIETAWGLPLLGHSADASTNLIEAPFKPDS